MTRIILGKVMWLGRTMVFCVVPEVPLAGTGGGNARASRRARDQVQETSTERMVD
ncbi:MAG TPA: hypothetical protein VFY59_12990 [Rubrobacter sp.]|nr:hypothetical protein [Rubrobacter sp.]